MDMSEEMIRKDFDKMVREFSEDLLDLSLNIMTKEELELLANGYIEGGVVSDNNHYLTISVNGNDILRTYIDFSPMVTNGEKDSYWVEKRTFNKALEYWNRWDCKFLKKEVVRPYYEA